jgi:pyruvate dehydrogenase E1 component beta subunit
VEKTGRLVVIDEASPRCNVATDVAALAAQEVFRHLKAPIKMVTPPHTPVPFSPELEDLYVPSPEKIRTTVTEVVRYR